MSSKRWRVMSSAVVLAALSRAVIADPVIYSTTSNLLPNTPGQQVQLYIAGTDLIYGEDLNILINTGASGPIMTDADVLTGTIFASSNQGQTQTGIIDSGTLAGRFAILAVATMRGDTTVDNGLLVMLTLDTTGLSSGTFYLDTTNTPNGPSGLVTTNATIIDLSNDYLHNQFSIGDANRQWNVNGSGTWNSDPNWTPFAPRAAGDAANFFGALTTATTASITVDGPIVVGALNFNNTIGSYALIPQNTTVGSLELNNGAAAPMINDSAGSHSIAAPITLDGSTNVTVVRPGDVMTLSGAISGATANLLVGGGGSVILSANNTYAATNIAGGATLQVGAGSTTGTLGTGPVTDNGTLAFNRSDAPSISNAISGTGALFNSGPGTLVLTGPVNIIGAANAVTGTIEFSGGVTHHVGAVNIAGAMQVDSGTTLVSDGVNSTGNWTVIGTQQIRPNGSTVGASKVGALTLGGGGKLDITNNLLVLEATTGKAAQLATVLNEVANGGITSSTLPLTPGTVIAVVDNQAPRVIRGESLDSGSIVVVQALQGDTDLSGTVDFADFTTLLQNYNTPQASRGWVQGNSTGQGAFADLTALLQNYNHSYGSFSVSPAGGASLSPAPAGNSNGSSSPAPEPASLAVLALGGAGLLVRRRKGRSSR